jgi:hypothetical protein
MGKKRDNTKNNCKCSQCQFFNKENDSCEMKNIKDFSKNEITECDDFLVKDKLIMF